MKRAIFLFLVVVIAAAAIWIFRTASTTASSSGSTAFEFGEAVQGEVLEHAFVIGNDGFEELRIASIDAPRSEVVAIDSVIPAGSQSQVQIRVDTDNYRGAWSEVLTVVFGGENVAPLKLTVTGQVVPEVQLSPQDRVYFFTTVGEGGTREYELINHREQPLELLEATSDNVHMRVVQQEIERGRRYRLQVSLDPETPVGRHEGLITLSTSQEEYATIEIKSLALVRNIVSTNVSRVDFSGFMLEDLDRDFVARKRVRVQKQGGIDFRVTDARTDLAFLETEIETDEEGAQYSVYVRIIRDRIGPGAFQGTLSIETNDSDFPVLELPIRGEGLE